MLPSKCSAAMRRVFDLKHLEAGELFDFVRYVHFRDPDAEDRLAQIDTAARRGSRRPSTAHRRHGHG